NTVLIVCFGIVCYFFFQAEDGIRDFHVTGVQTCALPIWFVPALPTRLAAQLTPRSSVESNVRICSRRNRCDRWPGRLPWAACPSPRPTTSAWSTGPVGSCILANAASSPMLRRQPCPYVSTPQHG